MTNEEMIDLYNEQTKCGNEDEAEKTMMLIVDKNEAAAQRLINEIIADNNNLIEEDIKDLKQEAKLAIVKAVKSYDKEKAKFSTHVFSTINFTFKDWKRRDHMIRIPLQKQWQCAQYLRILLDYKQKHKGNMPSDEYMLETLEVEVSTFRDIKAAIQAYQVDSLNKEVESGDGTVQIGDLIEDPRDCFEDIINEFDEDIAKNHIRKLKNDNEAGVIIDYFFDDKEISEIGVDKNLSRQHVNRIKNNALLHLRQMKEFKKI